MIIILVITIIILLSVCFKIKESFMIPGSYAKPSIEIKYSKKIRYPHKPKKGRFLKIFDNINGYQYYVGGGLANSYYTYGFKPQQVSGFVDLNDTQFNFNHKRQIYEKSVVLNKLRIVPLISLAIKELNEITRKNIDKMNDIQDKMFKIEEKEKKKHAKKNLY